MKVVEKKAEARRMLFMPSAFTYEEKSAGMDTAQGEPKLSGGTTMQRGERRSLSDVEPSCLTHRDTGGRAATFGTAPLIEDEQQSPGFIHRPKLMTELPLVEGERRQVGGIPAAFVAPRIEPRASGPNAAPLVEEKPRRTGESSAKEIDAERGEGFTDTCTGVTVRLADLLKALE